MRWTKAGIWKEIKKNYTPSRIRLAWWSHGGRYNFKHICNCLSNLYFRQKMKNKGHLNLQSFKHLPERERHRMHFLPIIFGFRQHTFSWTTVTVTFQFQQYTPSPPSHLHTKSQSSLKYSKVIVFTKKVATSKHICKIIIHIIKQNS